MIAILQGDQAHITTTQQADLDWEATFPNAWHCDRYEAMAAALEQEDVTGFHELGMKEPGETWAFPFYFENRELYGKINLLKSGKNILIYSSHIPRRRDKLWRGRS